jgi:RNA polymerase sigma-70 factor (ECF subfamily)
MNSLPKTRVSLILRLPNVADAEAWTEFTEAYEPFLYRYARRRGLQDADARELTQEVFLGVARAIGRWKPDDERARFRTWLFRIARNQTVNLLSSRTREVTVDSTAWIAASDDLVEDDQNARCEEDEYRREVFLYAAARVQQDVQQTTWAAFWRTTIVGEAAQDVAVALGISRGLVYVARSRVIRRLRAEIKRIDEEPEK